MKLLLIKTKNILKISVFTFLVFSFLTSFLGSEIYAQELTRELMKLDETLYDESKNTEFHEPKSILIVPIEPPVSGFNLNSSEWFQGMYYYMAGRLGLGDILFHYGISQDGLVFSGITNGAEQNIFVKDGPKDPIVIAYLSESGLNDFDKNGYSDLSEFLLNLANEHSIPINEIYVKKLDFIKNSDSFLLQSKKAGGRYELTLSDIKKEIKDKYNPQPKVYKVSVSNLELPKEGVNAFDEVVVKFDVTNTNKFTIFKGTDSEFILSKKDGKPSRFYNEGSWLTRTDTEIMKDGSLLRQAEKVTVEVKLLIPLYFGLQSEVFVLKDLNGKVYPGTEVKIDINVKKLNEPVVEVLDTETGSLNVRNVPNGSEIVTTVLPGERFVQLDAESGWVKIKISDTKSGWVLGKYVRTI